MINCPQQHFTMFLWSKILFCRSCKKSLQCCHDLQYVFLGCPLFCRLYDSHCMWSLPLNDFSVYGLLALLSLENASHSCHIYLLYLSGHHHRNVLKSLSDWGTPWKMFHIFHKNFFLLFPFFSLYCQPTIIKQLTAIMMSADFVPICSPMYLLANRVFSEKVKLNETPAAQMEPQSRSLV